MENHAMLYRWSMKNLEDYKKEKELNKKFNKKETRKERIKRNRIKKQNTK